MYYIMLFYEKYTKITWCENVFVSILLVFQPWAAGTEAFICYFENKDDTLHTECINSVWDVV